VDCCSIIPFNQLPFSKLFNDYIQNPEKLKPFYEKNPLCEKETGNFLKSYEFRGDRKRSVELLKSFNKKFDAGNETISQIEKLRHPDCLAVVTGQQLALYGGPLFTVYKTVSAIVLAHKLENKYKRPVVPVFWLADEDHDFEEASTLGILDRDEWHQLTFEIRDAAKKPVGRIEFNPEFSQFRETLSDYLFDTDFTHELTNLLDICYRPGATFREAFGKLILNLFSKHGLILAGSDDEEIKKYSSHILKKSVQRHEKIYDVLNASTKKLLDNGYHQQVKIGKTNLFWLDENQSRVKLDVDDEGNWFTENSKAFTVAELMEQIDSTPGSFSPNVFMRPLLQDYLLPAAAYVAGPGELAYYAQMKNLYGVFEMKMPMIMPRFSATLLESNIDRIMEKLPFKIGEYDKRIEDLESEFIGQAEKVDVEAIFNDWKKKTDKITREKKEAIGEIDPTLKGSAGKVTANYFTELDKLKGKIYRSIKQQEETDLKRIHKIKANLFPGGGLQERQVAFIYFMNKYGIDIWDKTISFFKNEEPVNHKVIKF